MQSTKLPLRLGRLLGWYLLIYFVVVYLRGLLQPGGVARMLEALTAHRVALMATSIYRLPAIPSGPT